MLTKNLKLVTWLVLLSIPSFLFANAAIPALAWAVRTGANNASSPSDVTATAYDWVEFGFNAEHSGNDTLETTITSLNVNTLQKLFQVALPDVADGAPAYLTSVNTGSNGHLLDFGGGGAIMKVVVGHASAGMAPSYAEPADALTILSIRVGMEPYLRDALCRFYQI